MLDSISGETITYKYDELKRLVSACSSVSDCGTAGTAFQYDGFGNLTSKTLSGTTTSIAVTGKTNQLANATYDANGNMTSGAGTTLTYDEANRVASARTTSNGSLTECYGYAPDNKRIYRLKTDGTEEWTFYGARGEKLRGEMKLAGQGIWDNQGVVETGYFLYFFAGNNHVWYGGRMVWDGTGPLLQDRLGTNRAGGARFYPYGEEITSTANDRTKFATYKRDGFTGLDYADQRYYASSYGRFNTPDPYGASAGPADPSSWNRYSYTRGDPVNRSDPEGLEDDGGSDGCCYNGIWVSGCDIPGTFQRFAPVTAFGRATQRLGAAVGALEDRSSVSPDCQKDLDALSQQAPQTIDLAAIQGALADTDFKNGVGSTLPVSALAGPGLASYGTALQNDRDGKYGPGQTVGNEFARNPGGLTAETVLGGSTIFINPTLIGGSLTSNEGLLFHEALHELGLIDQQVQQALGFKDYDNVSDTRRISAKLTKDCITGKGNN